VSALAAVSTAWQPIPTWGRLDLSHTLGSLPQRRRDTAGAAAARLRSPAHFVTDPSALSDEDLIRAIRAAAPEDAAAGLEPLFRRHQKRVAAWCLRICGRREEAADLAQEVFLRVQERLHTFRFESSFSTWLYLVTRSVAINRGMASRRRAMASLDDEGFPEPIAESPDPVAALDLERLGGRLRPLLRAELTELERRVLYLHVVDEMTLPGIDRLLGLTNRSGAKAFLVSAKRKLRRLLSELPR
jgi:RNA polymerase sigma-70 factor (ECF subfamily)